MKYKIGICMPSAYGVPKKACDDASAQLTTWAENSGFATEKPLDVIDITLFDDAPPSLTPARVKYFSRFRRLEVDVPITLSFFEPKDQQQAVDFTLRLAAHALRYAATRLGWDARPLDGLKSALSSDSQVLERFEGRLREAESFVLSKRTDEDVALFVTVERKTNESPSAFARRLAALERLVQEELERGNLGELDGSDILEEVGDGQVFCVVNDFEASVRALALMLVRSEESDACIENEHGEIVWPDEKAD